MAIECQAHLSDDSANGKMHPPGCSSPGRQVGQGGGITPSAGSGSIEPSEQESPARSQPMKEMPLWVWVPFSEQPLLPHVEAQSGGASADLPRSLGTWLGMATRRPQGREARGEPRRLCWGEPQAPSRESAVDMGREDGGSKAQGDGRLSRKEESGTQWTPYGGLRSGRGEGEGHPRQQS